MIYTASKNEFYIHLFVDSTVEWTESVSFTQATNFPDYTWGELTVHGNGSFAVNIRYPSWVEPGSATLSLNGEKHPIPTSPVAYLRISRPWVDGDVLRWNMPLHDCLRSIKEPSRVAQAT